MTPGVATVRYQRPGEKTAAFAKEWIAAHAGGPFFFFFHIFEPHAPVRARPSRSSPSTARRTTPRWRRPTPSSETSSTHLRSLGLYEKAIVVVTSDHGEGLGDHGEEQHSLLLYREAIQVPLLVKLPGSRGGGTRVAAPVQLSDILPTVTGRARPSDARGGERHVARSRPERRAPRCGRSTARRSTRACSSAGPT